MNIHCFSSKNIFDADIAINKTFVNFISEHYSALRYCGSHILDELEKMHTECKKHLQKNSSLEGEVFSCCFLFCLFYFFIFVKLLISYFCFNM